MAFNLDNYTTVAERLRAALDKHEKNDIRIITDLVHVERDKDGKPIQYICRTQIWFGQTLEAQDLAEEMVGSSNVNRTSALENCSTSACGRALALIGFMGTDPVTKKPVRPSREEMEKVVKGETELSKPLYGRPNSRSAAMEMALRNDIANNPWQAPVLSEPAPVEWSVNDVAAALNADPVSESFDCKHGSMIKKVGDSKTTKKPYYGFVCAVNEKAEQCPSRWAKITANGKWYFDEPDKDK